MFCKAVGARPSTYPRNLVTVAILAQGTSWAVADTQAFFAPRIESTRAALYLKSKFRIHPKLKENVPIPNLGLE